MAKFQQIVGFRVGKENFGVPIGIVHEIVRMMDITVAGGPFKPSFGLSGAVDSVIAPVPDFAFDSVFEGSS
jgi:hypothetical protein